MSLRIGTRGSALALAQARTVAALFGTDAELVVVVTTGDRASATGAGSGVNDKERWVKELELALLAGDIDLAVHSAKDVPSRLPEGLELLGAPPRGDPLDALVGAQSLHQLPAGARVGTASLRRAAQLLALREDLEIVVVRGNVDTRLRRLAEGDLDALVLAAAGLQRLGRADEIGGRLSALVPAPGQGTLVLEGRVGDAPCGAGRAGDQRRGGVVDAPRRARLRRAAGRELQHPAGRARDDRPTCGIVMRTFAGLPDGSAWLRDETPPAPTPVEAGELAAERLLAAGGGDLLARAEELATS